jgi:exosome complex component RRP41
VYGPHEIGNRGDMQHDRATVNVEVGSAAFARTAPRRAARTDRRAAEAARALKGTLEQTIVTELLPRSQVIGPQQHTAILPWGPHSSRQCQP